MPATGLSILVNLCIVALPRRAPAEEGVARAPFVWVDGPLVEAMRNGDIFLIDELNLAEDAVLERLNRLVETVGRERDSPKGFIWAISVRV